jgi:aminoglycoside phosphotransferase (APT) family kinase protein
MNSINPQSILASLGIHDATRIEPVTGGASTAIWRVEHEGNVYALRVFRPEQAAGFEREVAAMEAARAGGVSVPAIIQHGTWEDHPVMLLSWLTGIPLAAQLQQHPLSIWKLGTGFGRAQAMIHRIAAPLTFDSTAWIEWAGNDETALKQRLYDLPSRGTTLLHLDFHPLNVMADETGISGVLDWTNAQAGDPRADFARTYTILRVEPYSPSGDSPKMAFFRRALEWTWRHGYQQAGGKLDDMALFYAWAGAVMVRDLSPRIGKPGFWLLDKHLDPVRQWTADWKQRAGIR